ncbi:MAG: SagB/ThcOx family dehydrogenase [Proteobacteria bacterium]|nr:SagB/ThcOx family dehydrogenase [Pseudomonadota bacterium]
MQDYNEREANREFLKDTVRLRTDFSQTDQSRGISPPPIEKPFDDDAERVDLVSPGLWKNIGTVDLTTAIEKRASHRSFRDEPLTLEELSYLLWATQGVRTRKKSGSMLRTVPSAGCRHAFETYLCIFKVENLKSGVYRYLPLEHQLVLEFAEEGLSEKIGTATHGQGFTGRSAVTFVWTAVPYRMEWRYGQASYKVIAIDAGHVGQNLYLACSAVQAGTCAVAAYRQKLMDDLLRVDGKDEFVVYLAPVGKI